MIKRRKGSENEMAKKQQKEGKENNILKKKN